MPKYEFGDDEIEDKHVKDLFDGREKSVVSEDAGASSDQENDVLLPNNLWAHWRFSDLTTPMARPTEGVRLQLGGVPYIGRAGTSKSGRDGKDSDNSLQDSTTMLIRANVYAGDESDEDSWKYLEASSPEGVGIKSWSEPDKVVFRQSGAAYFGASTHNINDWYCRISHDRSMVKACFFAGPSLYERCGKWSTHRSTSPATSKSTTGNQNIDDVANYHITCEVVSTTIAPINDDVEASPVSMCLTVEAAHSSGKASGELTSNGRALPGALNYLNTNLAAGRPASASVNSDHATSGAAMAIDGGGDPDAQSKTCYVSDDPCAVQYGGTNEPAWKKRACQVGRVLRGTVSGEGAMDQNGATRTRIHSCGDYKDPAPCLFGRDSTSSSWWRVDLNRQDVWVETVDIATDMKDAAGGGHVNPVSISVHVSEDSTDEDVFRSGNSCGGASRAWQLSTVRADSSGEGGDSDGSGSDGDGSDGSAFDKLALTTVPCRKSGRYLTIRSDSPSLSLCHVHVNGFSLRGGSSVSGAKKVGLQPCRSEQDPSQSWILDLDGYLNNSTGSGTVRPVGEPGSCLTAADHASEGAVWVAPCGAQKTSQQQWIDGGGLRGGLLSVHRGQRCYLTVPGEENEIIVLGAENAGKNEAREATDEEISAVFLSTWVGHGKLRSLEECQAMCSQSENCDHFEFDADSLKCLQRAIKPGQTKADTIVVRSQIDVSGRRSCGVRSQPIQSASDTTRQLCLRADPLTCVEASLPLFSLSKSNDINGDSKGPIVASIDPLAEAWAVSPGESGGNSEWFVESEFTSSPATFALVASGVRCAAHAKSFASSSVPTLTACQVECGKMSSCLFVLWDRSGKSGIPTGERCRLATADQCGGSGMWYGGEDGFTYDVYQRAQVAVIEQRKANIAGVASGAQTFTPDTDAPFSAYCSAGGTATWIRGSSDGGGGWTDAVISVNVHTIGAKADNAVVSGGVGIVFRVADATNYYAVVLSRSGKCLRLFRVTDGQEAVLFAKYDTDPFPADNNKNAPGLPGRHATDAFNEKGAMLSVQARGREILVYLDGEIVAEAEDTSFNAIFGPGGAGVYSSGGPGNARFTGFHVERIAGSLGSSTTIGLAPATGASLRDHRGQSMNGMYSGRSASPRLPMRLRGGQTPTSGRLEVFVSGRWATVSGYTKGGWKDNGLSGANQLAAVACRHMGFPDGGIFLGLVGKSLHGKIAQYGLSLAVSGGGASASRDTPVVGRGNATTAAFDCAKGTETTVADCGAWSTLAVPPALANISAYQHHDNDVTIACEPARSKTLSSGTVRLVGSSGLTAWEGRLEYFNGARKDNAFDGSVGSEAGAWEAVCGKVGGWNDDFVAATNNAKVACRELGLTGGDFLGLSRGLSSPGDSSDVKIGGSFPRFTGGSMPAQSPIFDMGAASDNDRGWFDVQGQGVCNDYCRWVGNAALGEASGRYWWSCALAGKSTQLTSQRDFAIGLYHPRAYPRCSAKTPSAGGQVLRRVSRLKATGGARCTGDEASLAKCPVTNSSTEKATLENCGHESSVMIRCDAPRCDAHSISTGNVGTLTGAEWLRSITLSGDAAYVQRFNLRTLRTGARAPNKNVGSAKVLSSGIPVRFVGALLLDTGSDPTMAWVEKKIVPLQFMSTRRVRLHVAVQQSDASIVKGLGFRPVGMTKWEFMGDGIYDSSYVGWSTTKPIKSMRGCEEHCEGKSSRWAAHWHLESEKCMCLTGTNKIWPSAKGTTAGNGNGQANGWVYSKYVSSATSHDASTNIITRVGNDATSDTTFVVYYKDFDASGSSTPHAVALNTDSAGNKAFFFFTCPDPEGCALTRCLSLQHDTWQSFSRNWAHVQLPSTPRRGKDRWVVDDLGWGNWLATGPCSHVSYEPTEADCRARGASESANARFEGGKYISSGPMAGQCVFCMLDAADTALPCGNGAGRPLTECRSWRYVDTIAPDISGRGNHLFVTNFADAQATVDRLSLIHAGSTSSNFPSSVDPTLASRQCRMYYGRRYHGAGFGAHTEAAEALDVSPSGVGLAHGAKIATGVRGCESRCRVNADCMQATYDAKQGRCYPSSKQYGSYENNPNYVTIQCDSDGAGGLTGAEVRRDTPLFSDALQARNTDLNNDAMTLVSLTDATGRARVELTLTPSGSLVAETMDMTNMGMLVGVASPAGQFPLDTWVHVVAKFTHASTLIMLDGETVAEDARPATPTNAIWDNVLTLGSNGFSGDVDELRFWRGIRSNTNLYRHIFSMVDRYGGSKKSNSNLVSVDPGLGLDFFDPAAPASITFAGQYGYFQTPSNRGFTALSDTSMLATAEFITKPTPIRSLRVSEVRGGSLRLSWEKPLDTGGGPIDSYFVDVQKVVGINPDGSFILEAYSDYRRENERTKPKTSDQSTGSALTASIFRLEAESRFEFVVRAKSSNVDNPEKSDGVRINVTLASKNVPGAPFQATVVRYAYPDCDNIGTELPPCLPSGGAIAVKWEPPYSNGGDSIAGYMVRCYYRGAVTGPLVTPPQLMPGSPQNVSTTKLFAYFSGLSRSSNYEFTVSAINSAGEGMESTPTLVATSSGSKPDYVRSLRPGENKAIITGGATVLRWDPPVDMGGVSAVSGYKVFKVATADVVSEGSCGSDGPDCTLVLDVKGGPNGAPPATETRIGQLMANTGYYYRVLAYNEFGDGVLGTAGPSPHYMEFGNQLSTVTTGYISSSDPSIPDAPLAPFTDDLGITGDSITFGWKLSADTENYDTGGCHIEGFSNIMSAGVVDLTAPTYYAYEVQMCDQANYEKGIWELIYNGPRLDKLFIDKIDQPNLGTGIAPGSNYYVRVRVKNICGNAKCSDGDAKADPYLEGDNGVKCIEGSTADAYTPADSDRKQFVSAWSNVTNFTTMDDSEGSVGFRYNPEHAAAGVANSLSYSFSEGVQNANADKYGGRYSVQQNVTLLRQGGSTGILKVICGVRAIAGLRATNQGAKQGDSDFAKNDAAAPGGQTIDYEAQVIVFASGEITKVCKFEIWQDTLWEYPDEKFELFVESDESMLKSSFGDVVDAARAIVTITIVDDGDAGEFRIKPGQQSVAAGESILDQAGNVDVGADASVLSVELERLFAFSGQAIVTMKVTPITATWPLDYKLLDGTIQDGSAQTVTCQENGAYCLVDVPFPNLEGEEAESDDKTKRAVELTLVQDKLYEFGHETVRVSIHSLRLQTNGKSGWSEYGSYDGEISQFGLFNKKIHGFDESPSLLGQAAFGDGSSREVVVKITDSPASIDRSFPAAFCGSRINDASNAEWTHTNAACCHIRCIQPPCKMAPDYIPNPADEGTVWEDLSQYGPASCIPGRPRPPKKVESTGGSITLELQVPSDKGSSVADITKIHVYMSDSLGDLDCTNSAPFADMQVGNTGCVPVARDDRDRWRYYSTEKGSEPIQEGDKFIVDHLPGKASQVDIPGETNLEKLRDRRNHPCCLTSLKASFFDGETQQDANYYFFVVVENSYGTRSRDSYVLVAPTGSRSVPHAPHWFDEGANLGIDKVTAGMVNLRWYAPTNDGGIGVDYYELFFEACTDGNACSETETAQHSCRCLYDVNTPRGVSLLRLFNDPRTHACTTGVEVKEDNDNPGEIKSVEHTGGCIYNNDDAPIGPWNTELNSPTTPIGMDSTSELEYTITKTNAKTNTAFIYTKAEQHIKAGGTYRFGLRAHNSVGSSEDIVDDSGYKVYPKGIVWTKITVPASASMPSTIPPTELVRATGGSLAVTFREPFDRGGEPLKGFLLLMTHPDDGAGAKRWLCEFGKVKNDFNVDPSSYTARTATGLDTASYDPQSPVTCSSVASAQANGGRAVTASVGKVEVTGLLAEKTYTFSAAAFNSREPDGSTTRKWRHGDTHTTRRMSSPAATAAPEVVSRTGGLIEVGWKALPKSWLDWGGYASLDTAKEPELSTTSWRLFYRKKPAADEMDSTCGPSSNTDKNAWKEVLGDQWSDQNAEYVKKQVGRLLKGQTYEFRLRAMNPQALCFEPGHECDVGGSRVVGQKVSARCPATEPKEACKNCLADGSCTECPAPDPLKYYAGVITAVDTSASTYKIRFNKDKNTGLNVRDDCLAVSEGDIEGDAPSGYLPGRDKIDAFKYISKTLTVNTVPDRTQPGKMMSTNGLSPRPPKAIDDQRTGGRVVLSVGNPYDTGGEDLSDVTSEMYKYDPVITLVKQETDGTETICQGDDCVLSTQKDPGEIFLRKDNSSAGTTLESRRYHVYGLDANTRYTFKAQARNCDNIGPGAVRLEMTMQSSSAAPQPPTVKTYDCASTASSNNGIVSMITTPVTGGSESCNPNDACEVEINSACEVRVRYLNACPQHRRSEFGGTSAAHSPNWSPRVTAGDPHSEFYSETGSGLEKENYQVACPGGANADTGKCDDKPDWTRQCRLRVVPSCAGPESDPIDAVTGDPTLPTRPRCLTAREPRSFQQLKAASGDEDESGDDDEGGDGAGSTQNIVDGCATNRGGGETGRVWEKRNGDIVARDIVSGRIASVHSQARQSCRAAGARLCTAVELMAGIGEDLNGQSALDLAGGPDSSDTSTKLDGKFLWSSTKCDAGEKYTVVKVTKHSVSKKLNNEDKEGTLVKATTTSSECMSSATTLFFRCCGDEDLGNDPETAGGTLQLGWELPMDRGGIAIDRYKIYSVDGAGATSLLMETASRKLAADETMLEAERKAFVTGLAAQNTYRFSVLGVNKEGDGDMSSPIVATTGLATAPTPPSGLTLDSAPSGDTISLRINEPSEKGGLELNALRLQRVKLTLRTCDENSARMHADFSDWSGDTSDAAEFHSCGVRAQFREHAGHASQVTSGGVGHSEAMRQCSTIGARLCSSEELASGLSRNAGEGGLKLQWVGNNDAWTKSQSVQEISAKAASADEATLNGGKFVLRFNGANTEEIEMHADAAIATANIQSALDRLSTIGAGGVTVEAKGGTIERKWQVTFNHNGGVVASKIVEDDAGTLDKSPAWPLPWRVQVPAFSVPSKSGLISVLVTTNKLGGGDYVHVSRESQRIWTSTPCSDFGCRGNDECFTTISAWGQGGGDKTCSYAKSSNVKYLTHCCAPKQIDIDQLLKEPGANAYNRGHGGNIAVLEEVEHELNGAVSASGVVFTLSELSHSTKYWFRAQVKTLVGWSKYSMPIDFTTGPATISSAPPAPTLSGKIDAGLFSVALWPPRHRTGGVGILSFNTFVEGIPARKMKWSDEGVGLQCTSANDVDSLAITELGSWGTRSVLVRGRQQRGWHGVNQVKPMSRIGVCVQGSFSSVVPIGSTKFQVFVDGRAVLDDMTVIEASKRAVDVSLGHFVSTSTFAVHAVRGGDLDTDPAGVLLSGDARPDDLDSEVFTSSVDWYCTANKDWIEGVGKYVWNVAGFDPKGKTSTAEGSWKIAAVRGDDSSDVTGAAMQSKAEWIWTTSDTQTSDREVWCRYESLRSRNANAKASVELAATPDLALDRSHATFWQPPLDEAAGYRPIS